MIFAEKTFVDCSIVLPKKAVAKMFGSNHKTSKILLP